jgi:hypothetical protein
VLGQVYLNLANQGAKIVIEAKDLEEKLDEIIKKYTDENKLLDLDAAEKEMNAIFAPVLHEYGKDNYKIDYRLSLDENVSMSINNQTGAIYISVNGATFGNAKSMLTDMMHEGGHGTYYNYDLDENAIRSMIQNEETDSPIKGVAMTTEMANRILENSGRALIEELNGDLRDAIIIKSIGTQGEGGVTVGATGDIGFIFDSKNKKVIAFGSKTINPGFALSMSLTEGTTVTVIPRLNTADELKNAKFNSVGVSASAFVLGASVDLLYDMNSDEALDVMGTSTQFEAGVGTPVGLHSYHPTTTFDWWEDISDKIPESVWKYIISIDNSYDWNAINHSFNARTVLYLMEEENHKNVDIPNQALPISERLPNSQEDYLPMGY